MGEKHQRRRELHGHQRCHERDVFHRQRGLDGCGQLSRDGDEQCWHRDKQRGGAHGAAGAGHHDTAVGRDGRGGRQLHAVRRRERHACADFPVEAEWREHLRRDIGQLPDQQRDRCKRGLLLVRGDECGGHGDEQLGLCRRAFIHDEPVVGDADERRERKEPRRAAEDQFQPAGERRQCGAHSRLRRIESCDAGGHD